MSDAFQHQADRPGDADVDQPQAAPPTPFLIATSPLADLEEGPVAAIVLMREHEGTLALRIDRELGLIDDEWVLHEGGEVSSGDYFVALHSPDWHVDETVALSDSLALSSLADVIEAYRAGAGPLHSAFFTGYMGWEPGALESDLDAGLWVAAPLDAALVLDAPLDERWRKTLAHAGVRASGWQTPPGEPLEE
jgi:putative AlgH/UPF0301 family transcriptional regulator